MFKAIVIADSVNSSVKRITTLQVTYPRFIHPQLLRHRAFSRCVTSSRATPLGLLIQQVKDNPYIPEVWSKECSGMVSKDEIAGELVEDATKKWLACRDAAVAGAEELQRCGLHKQYANRVLEPYMWCTEVITATDWDNFFGLRLRSDVQYEAFKIASMMFTAMRESEPVLREASTDDPLSDLHLPYVSDEERACLRNQYGSDHDLVVYSAQSVSAGRVAKVSILRPTYLEPLCRSIRRAATMRQDGHLEPFEHTAKSVGSQKVANFNGWASARLNIHNESCFFKPPQDLQEVHY